MVLIGHRLHRNDLPSFAMKLGGYRRVELPLVGIRPKTISLSTGDWTRKKGELLRKFSHTKRQLERLKEQTLPDYSLFYQQGLAGRFRAVRANDFQTYDARHVPAGPKVLSVDTSQKEGIHNSFTVMQIWVPTPGGYYLVDQFREQCGFKKCRSQFWRFYKKYRPSAVLIEDRANGSALIEEVRRPSMNLMAIDPGRRSKSNRLQIHAPLIRRGMIYLPEEASWRREFIAEVVEFPSQFSDQVDALTQFLDFMATQPLLRENLGQGLGAGDTARSGAFAAGGLAAEDHGRIGVAVFGSGTRW